MACGETALLALLQHGKRHAANFTPYVKLAVKTREGRAVISMGEKLAKA
jgi:hypothetical protein